MAKFQSISESMACLKESVTEAMKDPNSFESKWVELMTPAIQLLIESHNENNPKKQERAFAMLRDGFGLVNDSMKPKLNEK